MLAEDVRRERQFYNWDTRPFIPVEFSAGAYRFAHSMVRADYQVRDGRPDTKDEPDARRLLAGAEHDR